MILHSNLVKKNYCSETAPFRGEIHPSEHSALDELRLFLLDARSGWCGVQDAPEVPRAEVCLVKGVRTFRPRRRAFFKILSPWLRFVVVMCFCILSDSDPQFDQIF